LPRAPSKSSNATLQPHKNLAIHQIRAGEQPHEALYKKEHLGVVLWVLHVVMLCHHRCRSPHQKRRREAAASTSQVNLDSTKCAQHLVYYSTKKFHDNTICM
jgi:hypothetical protein